MHELVNQGLEEVRSAARFRWYGMLAAWVICVGGWTWAAWQPDVFEANARVFVDTSSVLQPVLGNRIVAQNVATQIAYIREALLGREELEAVARDTGLDAYATSTAELDEVIAGLQTRIQIEAARGGPRDSADGVYNISYRNSRRDVAVAVVNETLNNFAESTWGANQEQTDTAEKFLDERVDEYEVRLAQAEQALAQFNKDNAGRLPGSQGGYFARMQTELEALEAARRELRILDSRRNELSAQLRGERAVVSDTSVLGAEPPPNSLDARIRDAETRLDALLLEYTERHPDVIALRDTLDRLLAQRAEQLAALGVEGADQEVLNFDTNPVYQALQMAINETDVDIATLRADITQREERIAELQSLVDEVPEVEAQFARLNRDYEVIYEQYLALVRSRETQDLTRKATDTDQIDFRIINPPAASPTPVAPNRMLLLAAVFVIAVGVGGGLSYLLAQLWPVFSSANVLRQRAGLPVLGIVTFAWREQLNVQRWRANAAYVLASLSLVIVFGALLGVEVLGPGLRQVLG
jgi:polysaccharide chain length determinant protein (PEP-CTERM system associated)